MRQEPLSLFLLYMEVGNILESVTRVRFGHRQSKAGVRNNHTRAATVKPPFDTFPESTRICSGHLSLLLVASGLPGLADGCLLSMSLHIILPLCLSMFTFLPFQGLLSYWIWARPSDFIVSWSPAKPLLPVKITVTDTGGYDFSIILGRLGEHIFPSITVRRHRDELWGAGTQEFKSGLYHLLRDDCLSSLLRL